MPAPETQDLAAPDADALIIGAGPAGLCCALSLAQAGLRVDLVERQPRQALADPGFDGREIALTHRSIGILKRLGVWERIPADEVSPLKDAVVITGQSPQRLHFDHREARCEALGQLVANHLIRRAAFEAAAATPGIRLFDARQVSSIRLGAAAASVDTGPAETLRARLLIGADSRFSDTRRAAGISADMLDFGKTMLVCRMRHTVSHEQTAWEWFQDTCTVALLPLNGSESSVVITVSAAEAQRLAAMDAAEFNRDMQARYQDRFGAMTLTSTRHLYPLVAVRSNRFVGLRLALIGDAAVGMHPVTAHGFNLGLQSAECLAQELRRAKTQGRDIGSLNVLERYESAHRRAALPLYLGTNAIVRLYTDSRPLHQLGRKLGLTLADRIAPVKRLMLASLTAR